MTTSKLTSREVVEQFYDSVNRGAFDEALNVFAEDVVGDDQLAGHFVGTDFLRRGFDAIRKGTRSYRVRLQSVLADGDVGAAIWQCESENIRGVRLAYPDDPDRPVIGASYFQLRNGAITYMRTIHDSVPFEAFQKV